MSGDIIYRSSQHGGTLPSTYANGQWRRMGLKLSTRPKVRIASFRDFLAGNPTLDLSTLDPYDQPVAGLPILNQGQLGDCVDNSEIEAIEEERLFSGQTLQTFSPAALYALTNGGVDGGSDPRDGITEWQNTGLCLASDVPPNTWVLKQNLPAAALITAARFRGSADSVYQINSLAELVTADWIGFSTTMTITVGNNFGPDQGSGGLVGFTPGPGNHQVCGGRAFRRVNGVPQFRLRNSWGRDWGMMGYFWITDQHFSGQENTLAFAFKWVTSDPLDPLNPPV
jgi:hypothetical protein